MVILILVNLKRAKIGQNYIPTKNKKTQPCGNLRQFKVLISPADNEGESGENKTEQGYFLVYSIYIIEKLLLFKSSVLCLLQA